jgi:hypothetical protein
LTGDLRGLIFVAEEVVMKDLDALYVWFDDNRDHIIADHLGECVLLKDNQVLGYYPNTDAALLGVRENHLTLGEFLIQKCNTREDDQLIYHNQAVTFG